MNKKIDVFIEIFRLRSTIWIVNIHLTIWKTKRQFQQSRNWVVKEQMRNSFSCFSCIIFTLHILCGQYFIKGKNGKTHAYKLWSAQLRALISRLLGFLSLRDDRSDYCLSFGEEMKILCIRMKNRRFSSHFEPRRPVVFITTRVYNKDDYSRRQSFFLWCFTGRMSDHRGGDVLPDWD